jgi:hypothetical protein
MRSNEGTPSSSQQTDKPDEINTPAKQNGATEKNEHTPIPHPAGEIKSYADETKTQPPRIQQQQK